MRFGSPSGSRVECSWGVFAISSSVIMVRNSTKCGQPNARIWPAPWIFAYLVSSARSHVGPFKERLDVGATPATELAGELGLEVSQPDVIGPRGGIHDDGMGAFEVATIDDLAAGTVVGPHFPKCDLLLAHPCDTFLLFAVQVHQVDEHDVLPRVTRTAFLIVYDPLVLSSGPSPLLDPQGGRAVHPFVSVGRLSSSKNHVSLQSARAFLIARLRFFEIQAR